MITDALLSAFLTPTLWLLNLLPAVDVTIPENAFDNMTGIFGGLGYFLPMLVISPVIVAVIALKGVKIVMALIVRIKSFIPTMGA